MCPASEINASDPVKKPATASTTMNTTTNPKAMVSGRRCRRPARGTWECGSLDQAPGVGTLSMGRIADFWIDAIPVDGVSYDRRRYLAIVGESREYGHDHMGSVGLEELAEGFTRGRIDRTRRSREA